MSEIYNILTEIKNHSKTTEKKEILDAHKDNQLLKKVILYALDQNYQSGIKKIPEPSEMMETMTLEEAIDSLNVIYSRSVTGNAARQYVADVLGRLDPDDREVYIKVLKKNLDCGIQAKNANAVFGSKFISDEPYMRCDLLTKDTIKNIVSFKTMGYAISEEKMDGQYLNHQIEDSSFISTSRNGVIYDFHNVFDDEMKRLLEITRSKDPRFSSGAVVMGECLVLDDFGNILPRTKGNGIIQKAGKDTITDDECEHVVFVLWDIVPYDAFQTRIWDVQRKERRELLESVLNELNSDRVRMIKYRKVTNIFEAIAYNKELTSAGSEGTIIKCETGIWKSHTSTKQLKVKIWMEIDMRIVGFIEGEGKRRGCVGSLILQSEDGIVKANCGSGFKEKDDEWTVSEMYRRFEELENGICTVKTNCITVTENNTSLFLPIFIEFRFDKDKADDYERIKEIEESAAYTFNEMLMESFKE